MSYILHILTPYRYPILAALSLLLIAEMALAGVDLIPIEYEWAIGWLMFLTIVAWAGIAVVIGVAPPADGEAPKDAPNPNIYVPDFSVDEPGGGNEPKRRGHLIWILSPALFAMLVLLAIWGANIFQAQFLLDLIRQPYMRVLVMVWIGMVVIVGATANIEHSKKTYLIMNVFPILVLVLSGLFMIGSYRLSTSSQPVADLGGLLGALFVFLLHSLVIGAVLRRTMLPDRNVSWITLAVITVVISAVSFVPVGVAVLLAIPTGNCNDCPGEAVALIVGFLIVIPVVLSLTNSVFATVLIGTMRRPIRNITVAGIGMAAMILLSLDAM